MCIVSGKVRIHKSFGQVLILVCIRIHGSACCNLLGMRVGALRLVTSGPIGRFWILAQVGGTPSVDIGGGGHGAGDSVFDWG